MTLTDNMPLLRPTYARIDLGALKYNLEKAKSLAAARAVNGHIPKIMFLVKADAYGHGIVPVAKYAQENKLCDIFAAASVEEGIVLRQNGITLPILVLGSIYPFEGFEYALKNNLSVTIASKSAAAYIKDLAAKLKITARCHIKQETGMNRIGSRKPAALEILRNLKEAPFIEVEGVYTHLADADDEGYTTGQLEYFKDLIAQAAAENLPAGLTHVCASGGFLKYPQTAFDMVRLGHLAYGLEEGFKPVLSLKSKIVFIKDIRPDICVSYNCTYKTKKPSRIATIPIGYGDGYHRALSNKAQVIINGQRCPLIGTVTMDMVMADISGIDGADTGSEVTLIGSDGNETVTAGELAELAGTIDYEITVSLSQRVPRLYV